MKILYLDMDNVIVDFLSGAKKIDPKLLRDHAQKSGLDENGQPLRLDDIEGIFSLMDPMPGAIEAVEELAIVFDLYILSSAPWDNPSAWSDKVRWLQTHFGQGKKSPVFQRLILSSHKNLNQGHFLVDDRLKKGAYEFGLRPGSEHVHFGQKGLENWKVVLPYLLSRA